MRSAHLPTSTAWRYTFGMFGHRPEIFVVGGCNGAGKTTTAALLLPVSLHVTHFVNADSIAKGLSPHDLDRSAFAAGRLMLERIRDLREQGETFSFESTLASRSFARFLREAQELDYVVHVIYLTLPSPDLAVERVSQRVRRGGHHIPDDTVRRRWTRSHRNFCRIYQPLADEWSVWDNSGRALVPVARGRVGLDSIIYDNAHWARVNHDGARDDS